jgi:Transposase IS116/IS110/IS902 family/AAA ATPase domain
MLARRLLERDAATDRLARALARARTGDGTLVVVEGMAGIGKSALLTWGRAAAADAGMSVLAARGGVLERDFAFGIVRQLFEPALAATTEADRKVLMQGPAALAGRLLALPVASDPGAGVDPAPDPSFAVLHGLYWLTASFAARCPVCIDDAASRITYADYLHAHDVLLARRDHVGRELERLAPQCAWAPTIARLCCLRGISTLTALGLCAEIGDWHRFDHPDALAAYVGLVPSEHSSGQSRRQGKITKAGSTHARRLLVEAALHYRLTPAVGGKLAARQRGQDPALIDHAWRVQRRLNARWNRLRIGRGKPAGVVTIAIARELVGACWEIATA